MISTIFESDHDFLKTMIELYVPYGFDLDPTYSKGIFYEKLEPPQLQYDINSNYEDRRHDCRKLPIDNESIRSIVFDPPFLAGGGSTGIMNNRFGNFDNFSSLWKFYNESLREFYRILYNRGFLFFKCQDCLNGGQQYFSHCQIYNMALSFGFKPRDLAILIKKNRATPWNIIKQQHLRKHHCYWWVFQKRRTI